MFDLYIAQKMFSLFGSSFDVKNAQGQVIYRVHGELSLTQKLAIFNDKHQEVGEVRKALISILPKYELYENGKKIGYIEKDFTLFHPKYTLSCGDWKVDGDLLHWNYSIYNGQGQLVGQIRKELWHLTDHYVITCDSEADALRILMVVLAIDCVNEGDNKNNNQNNQNN